MVTSTANMNYAVFTICYNVIKYWGKYGHNLMTLNNFLINATWRVSYLTIGDGGEKRN